MCTIGDAYLAVNEPKTQHDDRAPLMQRQPWCFVWIVALKMKTWNWGGRWTAGCRCNPVTWCRLDQGYQFSLQTSYHVHFCVGLSDTVVFHLCHQFPSVFRIIPETIGALVLLHLAMAMLRIIVQVKGYSGCRPRCCSLWESNLAMARESVYP